MQTLQTEMHMSSTVEALLIVRLPEEERLSFLAHDTGGDSVWWTDNISKAIRFVTDARAFAFATTKAGLGLNLFRARHFSFEECSLNHPTETATS
jgi:hypothetical protein